MTKFKTLCFLILAVTVFIWSADAAIQKTLQVRENLIVNQNLDKAGITDVYKGISVQSETNNANLTKVTSEEKTISSGSSARTQATVKAKEQLLAQLARSTSNSAIIQNADGSYTAAIRGTGTTSCSSVYELALCSDASGPWQAEVGVAYAAYNAPVFYYDLSLIPAGFTGITGANVDLHFEGSPWAPPTVNAYFDINDVFTWYDGTNYTATYDDILNTTTGNTYAQETTGFMADGTHNYVLDAQALTDIGTQVAGDGWFGLGLDPTVMAIGTESSWMMDPGYGQDTSILYVTFTAPGNNPVITAVTAVPSSVDNIGFDTITFTATWTDVDDHDLSEFGMIFKYKAPWDEEVQLLGGLWEKTGTGAYSWTGEWDPDMDHQIGAHDVSFLIWDGTFTDVWDYTVNDDLFTITSPAIDYTDFNTDGPLSQWPTGWVDSPTTDPGPPAISWQYDYRWSGTSDHIAYAHNAGAAQDCTLTSPVVDFTGMGTAHLFFDVLWEGTPTSFTLEGSIDGFANVADSIELTTTVAADEFHSLNWNITSWAAGESAVQIRFHFVAPITASAPDPDAGGIFDVIQFVAGDAPIVVTDTEVTPATGDVITNDSLDFSVDFTASATATVDDFVFDLYVQSDAGLVQALITGLSNGDAYGSVIVQNSPGDFTATLAGMTFLPGIEIGVYDLMGYASNGIDWDYDDFTDNEDELTITTESFWYEDFNDTGAAGPAGWSILSLPGGENGDDWIYDLYTGTTDYFGFVMYDQTTPADPQMEVLRTGVIDCTGKTNCTLYYSYEWASGFDAAATGEVRLSNDGGSNFTTIYTHVSPVDPSIETGVLELNIATYADGEDDVVLEFRYNATDDYYWSVDIVQIDDAPLLPIPSTGPIGLGLLLAAVGAMIIRRRK
ncbi:hypothetical protein K8T06_17525 [bacterium]|nr:hypothetical protein [bacterium]